MQLRCDDRASLDIRASSFLCNLRTLASIAVAITMASCSSGSSSGGGMATGGAAGSMGGSSANGGSGGSLMDASTNQTGGAGGTGGGQAGSGGGINRDGATNTGGDGAADSGRRTDGATAMALGAVCGADADCGTGLVCAKATDSVFFGNGGPPGGYCTVSCTPPGDVNCQAMGGTCVDLSANSTDPPAPYCLRPCTFGTDQTDKCLTRPDVGCVAADQTTMQGVCLPICSQDDQCPAGRRCDPRTAMCVNMPTAGDPLGNHCAADPDAAATCAGTCIAIGGGNGMLAGSVCSQRCVTGLLQGCNWVGQGVSLAGARHGVCAFSASMAMNGGDLGFCAELCDSVADCHDAVDPAPICDMSFASVIGHGICSWGPPVADAGNPPPRDARADGRD